MRVSDTGATGIDAAATLSPTDHELLAAHVAGDPQAFGILIARHKDRLWAVALRTMRDPDEAADALQDAMINAFRRADSFRGDSAVTTWLHRVVVNACLDRMRRNGVRRTSPLPEDGESEIPDTSDDLGKAELQWEIAAALATLPSDQREAITLVEVEGYSIDEAARILDCPSGTVKSRCSRGRARLAQSLGHLRNRTGPPDVGPPEAESTEGRPPGDQEGGST